MTGCWTCIYDNHGKCNKGCDGYCKLTKSTEISKYVEVVKNDKQR